MIHESAIVSPEAKIGSDAEIGPFSIIYGNVVLKDNVVIGSHCEIGWPTDLSDGSPLTIENNSIIRSHCVLYEGSSFGERLVTGHRVTVRENTIAGKNLQIGTLSDIQGDCEIGNSDRLHSTVFIRKRSRIGNFVWLFPYVVLKNDPHPPSEVLLEVNIKDYAIVATKSVILPGITINEHSLVGAHSLVNRDVPEGIVVGGTPAKMICETSEIKLKNSNESAYPWPKHIHRGYPNAIVEECKDKYSK